VKRMTVRKTKHTNTDNTKEEKNTGVSENAQLPLVIDEYYSVKSQQYHPVTVKFVEREALRLYEWADVDSSLRISQFYNNSGYGSDTFERWCKRFDFMHKAYLYAMSKIAERREIGALTRKFDSNAVFRTLGFYDPIYRSELDRANEMRAKYDEKKDIVVRIESFPSQSGRVEPEISVSGKTPEQLAANIKRNTATQREVRVKSDYDAGDE